MAAAFLAMNEVFGPVFAREPGRGRDTRRRRRAPARSPASSSSSTPRRTSCATTTARRAARLAQYAKSTGTPPLGGENDLTRYKFENYLKEIFVDSDTKVALLSGAPFDDPSW